MENNLGYPVLPNENTELDRVEVSSTLKRRNSCSNINDVEIDIKASGVFEKLAENLAYLQEQEKNDLHDLKEVEKELDAQREVLKGFVEEWRNHLKHGELIRVVFLNSDIKNTRRDMEGNLKDREEIETSLSITQTNIAKVELKMKSIENSQKNDSQIKHKRHRSI